YTGKQTHKKVRTPSSANKKTPNTGNNRAEEGKTAANKSRESNKNTEWKGTQREKRRQVRRTQLRNILVELFQL
ncbi:MAG: hypothetical protein ACP5OR_09355, partial [Candidatus Dormibacteria bacterium]